MPARLTTGVRARALFAVAGAFLIVGPSFASGCGSSSSPPPVHETVADASITYVMVTTGGGGAPMQGSSSGSMPTDPFATPDSSASGSSSGSAGDDGGGSLGDATADTGTMTSADAGDAASQAEAGPDLCADYTVADCGDGNPCDLRTHTCCVTLMLKPTCMLGTGPDTCPSDQASIHCQRACDCGPGKSCCGVENTLIGVGLGSECQAVPNPGVCSPAQQTATQASAQLCKLDAECMNGQKCIAQTCVLGTQFNICGVQNQDPFDCKANN